MMTFSVVNFLQFILSLTLCYPFGYAQQVWFTLGSGPGITTNNTEILMTHIGEDAVGGYSLTCNTDHTACCRSADNIGTGSLGQWTYPDGSLILNNKDSATAGQQFYRVRNGPQLIKLRRRQSSNLLTPTGSYCCTVPTTGGDMTLCANLVVCYSLLPPTNGVITYSDPTLGEGTVATYTCNSLYTLNGDSTRTCGSDGSWSGSTPAGCKKNARLAASNEPDGTDHTGEIISFSDVGSGVDGQPRPWYCYTFPGRAVWQFPNGSAFPINLTKGVAVGDEVFISGVHDPDAVVLHRGPSHFSPDGEHCCVRLNTNERRCVTFTPCPTLSPVSNGMISYDAASNVATYTCDTGYTVTGTISSITCNEVTMQWSSTERPTCELLCPDLTAPDNGGVMYSHTTTPRAEDSTATYTCGSGYQITGLIVRTCTATGWSTGDDHVCTAVCLSLPHPTNGMISYSDPTLGVGSVATFSCDPGFMISDAIRSTSDCRADGQWSSIPPTCMGSCPALIDIENGMVTYSGDTTEPYIYGTTAVCECNLGYELTSGDSERTCTGDVRSSVGEWSGATVVCSVVDCEQPTAPSNGEVSLPAGTTFSSVAYYSCNSCYRRLGVSLRICGGNGLWVPAPPTCEILDCDRPPDLVNGIITTPYTTTCSSVVTYSCDRGYLLEGVSSRSCQTNEEWSNGTALCNPIDCGSLSSPDNGGVVMLSGSTFMSRATYSCDNGYPLRGPAVRTCGPDGRWSQYPPSCEPVDCGALINPTNGLVDTSSGTTFMDRATYTCNIGHNLEGTSSRICLASGMWSSVQPTCEVVDCGALEDPTNGKVVIVQGTTFDQPAVYSCNEGYTLNGDARRTCTASGQWSGSATSCDSVDCGDLEAPANGYVSTSQGTHFMDTAVYSCAPGYDLTGCPEAVCQSNGTWSCNPPFCADNAMIQFNFGPTSYCVEWNDEKVKLMYKIMHIATTKAVGKSGHDIPINNIQPGYFVCYKSTTRTTYRTTITGTKSLSAVEYAELISEWVKSGVTTRVLWYAIKMDKACPVVITSMDKDECE